MFLTILLTDRSPNIYLQDSKARRPAATAAKSFNPGWGVVAVLSHQYGALPHLLTSLTTAAIKNEGLGSHFDRVPICVTPSCCWRGARAGGRGHLIWGKQPNVLLFC